MMTMGNSPRRCCSLHLKPYFSCIHCQQTKFAFGYPDGEVSIIRQGEHQVFTIGRNPWERDTFSLFGGSVHTLRRTEFTGFRIGDLSCTGHNGYCPAASSLYKHFPGRNTVFSRPVSSWGMFPYTKAPPHIRESVRNVFLSVS